MQPLIQPILSQIIDPCFYFPESESSVISLGESSSQELQLLHLKTNIVCGQKFTRNAKNLNV